MLEAFGRTDVGCVRKNNEDYFFIDRELGLYLLADGMGGAQAGEMASRLAVESVMSSVRCCDDRNCEVLLGAFKEANREVFSTAAGASHLKGMGTTLVGVMDSGDMLHVASVGDSRLYLFSNGELSAITEDHTWANEVGKKLGIDTEQMKKHPMRHVLTMCIGVENLLRINSYTLRLSPGDQLLLSSDGLHGVISAEEITKALTLVGDLSAKSHYLIEAAKQAGGPDNITVILLQKTA
jgi:protein phosphatase